MTKSTKRASARTKTAVSNPEAELLELLEHTVAAAALTSFVDSMRSLGFDDAFVVAALLAGAGSLINGLPEKEPWAAHLEQMAGAARAADVR
ncbi:hypothetical protein BPNPMPFG_000306 [Mesorhizobium sp. AR07]|uniref:hypothetical protein n=1 Tax=Mesorhizobium sp. AR07 TaxID=2865838 RepID=UPI002160B3CA|nr:hypothetical protein [Mesorhizobium sp. AR07]UVK44841.1 hypothetical protein BPNPMPFG_000306 [Mesorhizobium sp. AR07]